MRERDGRAAARGGRRDGDEAKRLSRSAWFFARDLKAKAYGLRPGKPAKFEAGEERYIHDLVRRYGPHMVLWFYTIARRMGHEQLRAKDYVARVVNNYSRGKFTRHGPREAYGEGVYLARALEVAMELVGQGNGSFRGVRRLLADLEDFVERSVDAAERGRRPGKYVTPPQAADDEDEDDDARLEDEDGDAAEEETPRRQAARSDRDDEGDYIE